MADDIEDQKPADTTVDQADGATKEPAPETAAPAPDEAASE